MMSSNIIFLVQLLLIFYYCICLIFGQDIGFPEREEDEKRKNANNRKPIFLPGQCKENELLFPGDQVDDWVCDCNPGYLYHPKSDKCYPAFRQGPCKDGNVLILPKNSILPECVSNSCNKDGQIPIKSRCYNLGEAGPCPNPELSYVLGVNITTLEITCVPLSINLVNRIGEDDNILNKINVDDVPICALGCKRYINGTCPKKFKQ